MADRITMELVNLEETLEDILYSAKLLKETKELEAGLFQRKLNAIISHSNTVANLLASLEEEYKKERALKW